MWGGSVDWSYFFGFVCPIFVTYLFRKFVVGEAMHREILAVFVDNWTITFEEAVVCISV